ncbi:hypothetical protein EAH85_14210 [Curtobacterium flaccumfaciens]|nr:hypothetical protein EAH85_14210 [Curtobacterium flaccumfaciens]
MFVERRGSETGCETAAFVEVVTVRDVFEGQAAQALTELRAAAYGRDRHFPRFQVEAGGSVRSAAGDDDGDGGTMRYRFYLDAPRRQH